MGLIAILFCLALQRFANVGGWFKEAWFEAYLKWLGPKFSKLNERFMVLFVVAPVLVLFVLIQLLFTWHWFGLVDLVLAITILFFCIDARDLKNRLVPYFQSLEKSDMHAAAVAVNEIISDESIGNIADLRREVTRAIFLNAFEKIFVGLFWFMVFGVYGLATYFLIARLSQTALIVNPSYTELARFSGRIKDVLDWLPVRLLGFSYALVGHFNKGCSYCIKNFTAGLSDIERIATGSGLAALDIASGAEVNPDENNAALDMVNRVLIIWLIGIVLVFIGVLF